MKEAVWDTAKKKSENSAPNRFCSKDFLSEAAKPDKQLPK